MKPRSRAKTAVSPAENGPSARALAEALLRWFAAHAEDLPWRRVTDPYAVWVSEIMLQQTQVGTVIPYYERWLRALPDVAALAAAPLERVLKLWEGLGYYTRARNLHRAAGEIMRRHDGRFPRAFAEVLALPGIGRYTAGAVCSIAFNQPRPILDGNVIRVLARVYGIAAPVRESATQKRLWARAEALVRAAARARSKIPSRPERLGARIVRDTPRGALNQALMELGRRVCTPRRPGCDECPLARRCRACREDAVSRLPHLGRRPATMTRRVVAVVIERRGRFLVQQRPAGGVNAGLWEFPNADCDGQPVTPATLAARWPLLVADSLRPLVTLQHRITRHQITLEVWRGHARPGPAARAPAQRWLRLAEAARRPFTAAHRRILEKLRSLSA
jgi:A/G-specific adenine glycosylase